mmetsp:Transcript_1476/g.6598  ORF Transcript_1476/g.6598 Transcript_1476/m.6598 type:complete len:236 (-) Transcript_1476:2354-3061(-)
MYRSARSSKRSRLSLPRTSVFFFPLLLNPSSADAGAAAVFGRLAARGAPESPMGATFPSVFFFPSVDPPLGAAPWFAASLASRSALRFLLPTLGFLFGFLGFGLASPVAPFLPFAAFPSASAPFFPSAFLPFFFAPRFCAIFAAAAAASALAFAFLSASYWSCFCLRPSLRRSSFFTARASSTANSMMGRLALLKTSGLLFSDRSAARACSWSANSTKPIPRDLGLPSASGLVGS